MIGDTHFWKQRDSPPQIQVFPVNVVSMLGRKMYWLMTSSRVIVNLKLEVLRA